MFSCRTQPRLAVLLLALLASSLALSSDRLPNVKWRLSTIDLRVETLSNVIAVERTWQSDNLKKMTYSLRSNPASPYLEFELEYVVSIAA